MQSLLSLALSFGGHEERGAILIPAERLTAFLAAAQDQMVHVPFIECLYLGPDFSEPSMELSRNRSDFPTWGQFAAFASEAAQEALVRARTGKGRRVPKSAEAVFEVGP